ncbi:leucine-rich repeat-containing protein 56 [Rhynchocyon petersi]
MEPSGVGAQSCQPSVASFRVQELSWPGHHNPRPQSKGTGSRAGGQGQQLLEEFLSLPRLQSLAQVDNLHAVTVLEMCVDTYKNSLGNFGAHLPRLSQLKLNGSRLASVRDLGTSLGHLQVLWLARCGLPDLDGIGSFPALKELYVSYNNVSDLSPLCLLEQLEVLDLEGNSVNDLGQVRYLQLCPRLAILTLEGNPVCLQPAPSTSNKVHQVYSYRAEVWRLIPQLQVLDEALATQTGQPAAQTLLHDWLMVKEAIREGCVLDGLLPELDRPQGAPAQRLGPMSPLPEAQLQTPSPWPLPLLFPGTSLPDDLLPEDLTPEDDASNLTHGMSHILCGNPTRGLRERRQQCLTLVPPEQLPCHRPVGLTASTSAPGPHSTDSPDLLALATLKPQRELFLSTLLCRHLESPKEGTAAPWGPHLQQSLEKQQKEPVSDAPRPLNLAPEPFAAPGCKLPSPPKYPLPRNSGTSTLRSTQQPFRGRRLRGLVQELPAVTALRAVEVTSGLSPRAQGHLAPRPVSEATPRPPGLRCQWALDPIGSAHPAPSISSPLQASPAPRRGEPV